MSLRTDIRTAFDVIAPPTGGLAERVVETARRQARRHTRSSAVMIRMRAPLSLVAIFVLIAVVVALFIGAQAVRFWNAQHTTAPAGVVSGLAQLEARPLTLPTLTATAPCPQKPGRNSLGFDFGDGPIYAMGGDYPDVSAWGNYWTIEYFVDPSVHGPVLIRGRDIRSANSVVFTGKHAAGPTVGSDSVYGRHVVQRGEAVLDPGTDPEVVSAGIGGWKIVQGMFAAWTGCFGLQIDGPTFSETIITDA